jgi:DNA-binding transcriptional LysR family regulator
MNRTDDSSLGQFLLDIDFMASASASKAAKISGLRILQKADETVEFAVGHKFITNDLRVLATAIIGGAGIGLIPAQMVESLIENGALVRILDGWCARISGVFLYYPSRKHIPTPLAAFISFMRDLNKLRDWP